MHTLEHSLTLFIEKLYNVSFPGVYRIARYFSMKYNDFMARIRKLHSHGFKFKFLLDLAKIDLREVVVIVDDVVELKEPLPFLRSYVRLIPSLTQMTFYAPLKSNAKSFVTGILKEAGITSVRDIIVARIHEHNKALLSFYKWSIDSLKDVRREEEWSKILFRLSQYLEEPSDTPVMFSEYLGPRILKAIYLRILKELEYNPFNKISDIEKKLGVRHRDVIRAMKIFEKSGVFKGIRLRYFPWAHLSDMFFTAILRAKTFDQAVALLNACAEFPLSAGGIVGEDNRVSITFIGNGFVYKPFEEIMFTLEDYGFRLEGMYVGLLSQSKRFSIPYIQGIEYDKYKKYWNIILKPV